MPAFTDLATATYCPRKLYYRRLHGDYDTPEAVAERRELAFRYEGLLAADDDTLRTEPIAVTPTQFRARLHAVRERLGAPTWTALVSPADRDVFLDGKECRGVAHKVLADPSAPSSMPSSTPQPTPSLVFTGEPPERGIWEPQSVHAVAAAKALAWEHETPVERAFVEYPAHGVVREVRLTTRRKAAYRRAVRAVKSLDGPPPRLRDDAKCAPCEYRPECGTRTRSLRSLLQRR